MRLHVWLTDEQVEAVTERAEVAGITRSEWIRASVQKVLETSAEQPGAPQGAPTSTTEEHGGAIWSTEKQALENQIKDLEMQISLHQEQIRSLPIVIAERDRLAGGTETLQERIKNLEKQVRGAELKAALTSKDLELSEARRQSLEEVRQGLEARVIDLRATAGMLEGQVATLMTAQNRMLTEGQKPWWRRIFG